MRLRSSAFARFCTRAKPGISTLRFVLLAITVAALSSCEPWVPVAGPVRPQLILEGPTRVETMLEETERYLLVSRFETDDEGNETRRYNVVDWKSRTHCELPEGVARIEESLLGPSEKRKRTPLFLLPVVLQQEAEGDEEPVQVLTFYDELCQLRGETDYGPVSTSTASLTLDEDGREVMLYGNGKGTLAMADPWRDERTQIAEGFRAFSSVYRAGSFSAPQLLWIIENGQLTQRALDGTLVLSLGERVTGFSQVLLAQLRVAYLDDGNVYEAIGPNFEPTRIAKGACAPVYRGNSLELHSPCSDSQLVRINLMTGELTTFDDGVFEAYVDGNFSFETKRDSEGLNHQFVTQPGREAVEITPPFLGRPFVVDSTHLAGIKNIDDDATKRALMVWSSETQKDTPVFPTDAGSVETYYAVTDYRTSSYWWLVFHNQRATEGAEGHQLGTLSIVSSRDLSVEQVADNVPQSFPVARANSVRGFSIEVLPTFIKERAIAYIEDAVPLSRESRASRGSLHVRLFSGALGSKIADDVTSYRLLSAPLPGVLYGVEEGEQQGLWFAAL
jgi:hypothetical protein